MTQQNHTVTTKIDCCFDDTILDDVIKVLTHIKNGVYKGSTHIEVLIPKNLVVCGDTAAQDCRVTIELGTL